MTQIPTLWPADKVSLDIVSPLAILKMQANALTTLTKGLLVGRVKSYDKEDQQRHQLQVFAPVIEVTYTLLEVFHDKHKPYPVSISGSGLLAAGYASTESRFIELLSVALSSDGTLGVINSAIAESNEADNTDETNVDEIEKTEASDGQPD
jgi:hypothetical protein